ncbi:MAG: hypothetical protein ACQESD_05955 [Thermoplasmatota archaeon]
MDWKKYFIVCIAVLIIILISVIFVNSYYFPRKVEDGLYFDLTVSNQYTDNMTFEQICQNLSKDDDLILSEKPYDKVILRSNNWNYVNNISIKVDQNNDLIITGTSTLYYESTFDRGGFSESSDKSKERIQSLLMNSLNIDISKEDIEIGDNDFAMMFEVNQYFCFVWFMIFLGAVFGINNVYKNRKYILHKERTPHTKTIYNFNLVDAFLLALIVFFVWFILAEVFVFLTLHPDISFWLAGISILMVGIILYVFRGKYNRYITNKEID